MNSAALHIYCSRSSILIRFLPLFWSFFILAQMNIFLNETALFIFHLLVYIEHNDVANVMFKSQKNPRKKLPSRRKKKIIKEFPFMSFHTNCDPSVFRAQGQIRRCSVNGMKSLVGTSGSGWWREPVRTVTRSS